MSLRNELNQRVELFKSKTTCRYDNNDRLEYLVDCIRAEADNGKTSIPFTGLTEDEVKYLKNLDLFITVKADETDNFVVTWVEPKKEIKNKNTRDSIELKMWDLVIDMGFTASAGLAREWILGGKVKVDKKIIKDNKMLVTVTPDSIVEVKDDSYQKADKMRVGDHLGYFRYQTSSSLF